uniref:uncharacterized protein LOC132693051 n=1 Tax=Panthera onca TaxID=9690 RepID=UPI002954D262|nr:uncharacterized protein LOC132693051 [Panthera onca]
MVQKHKAPKKPPPADAESHQAMSPGTREGALRLDPLYLHALPRMLVISADGEGWEFGLGKLPWFMGLTQKKTSLAVNHTTHPYSTTGATWQGRFSKPSTPISGGGGEGRRTRKPSAMPSPNTQDTVRFATHVKRRGVPCSQIFAARGFIRNRLLESRHIHGVCRTLTLQPLPRYPPPPCRAASSRCKPFPGDLEGWAGVRRGRSSAPCCRLHRRRCLRSCSPFPGCSGPAALPSVDRWAHPGPDGGAVGHVNSHLQFGSVPGGGGCSPAVGAAPAVSARLLRAASALCIVISVPASTQLAPGTGRKRTAAPEPAGAIRVAPRAAAWDMRRETPATAQAAAPRRRGEPSESRKISVAAVWKTEEDTDWKQRDYIGSP